MNSKISPYYQQQIMQCHRGLNIGINWNYFPWFYLTHWGRVTHICIGKLTIIGSSHYLNQCWDIVNSNLRNKLQWNLKRNSRVFFQEIAFENVVYEMASILSRPQCANLLPTINTNGTKQSLTYFWICQIRAQATQSGLYILPHINCMIEIIYIL